jgi:hypothetical protein
MSGAIFDRGAQLKESLLPPPVKQAANPRVADLTGSGSAAGLQESSSSSLDSSRRTLNQIPSASGEGDYHEFEAAMELASEASSRVAIYSFEDKQGSMDDKEEEELEEEEGGEATGSHEDLLLGVTFASDMIVNHSGARYNTATLPRPYNPG